MRHWLVAIAVFLSMAAWADESTEWQSTILPQLRSAIETITDPVEFGKLHNEIFREARYGPCDVGHKCYADVLALDKLWNDRRLAVAKANKRCARFADALATRQFDGFIGAPVECVYIGEGLPKEVNRTTTADGMHDQLVYGQYLLVYADNGIVTAVQH